MTPIQIHTPGRQQPIGYPPPPDVRYGELVRLRNLARKLNRPDALADLQFRITRMGTPSAQHDIFA